MSALQSSSGANVYVPGGRNKSEDMLQHFGHATRGSNLGL